MQGRSQSATIDLPPRPSADLCWAVECGSPVAACTAEPGQARAGHWATWATLCSMIIGSPLLEMGALFRVGGLVASTLVTFAMAAVCCLTMVLIARCLDRAAEAVPADQRGGEAVDWPLIGYAVAGRPGRILVGTVFFVDLVTTAVLMQILSGGSLAVVLPGVDERILMGASGCATVALLALPARHLGLLSAAGILAVCAFAASLFASAALLGPANPPGGYKLFDVHGSVFAVPIVATAMMAHSSVGPIYSRMNQRGKDRFPAISASAFAVAGVMYAAIGIIAYFSYSDGVHQNLISNVGFDREGQPLPGLRWLQKLAAVLFTAKLQSVQPLLIEPLSLAVHTGASSAFAACTSRSVAVAASESARDVEMPSPGHSSRKSGVAEPVDKGARHAATIRRLVLGAIRVACAAATIALAVTGRNKVLALAELTGSLACMSMSVTLPIVCYLTLHWSSLAMPTRVIFVVAATIGFTLQAMGVRQAVISLFFSQAM
uniref:Amino acid transporter transmembrane domain-containing protein n=1 Tax=Zooxanthella nutricula TaxID=1333877 RepID=A0A7S2NAW6_9DINO